MDEATINRLGAQIAASAKPATTPRELPELPEPVDARARCAFGPSPGYYTADQMHAYARQAIAESEARADRLRKLLAEMIELRQATQDGRVTDRHELDIVRDAKAAIAQEAEREAGSA